MTAATLTILDPVYAEWKSFLKAGKADNCKARQQIVESWVRCYLEGKNPYDNKLHQCLDDVELKRMIREKEKLINIAKPLMSNLYKFVKGSGFVVVLTDETGYIMERFCDEDTLQNPMTQNFYQGASWREEEAGTNAIGTALKNGEPIQVSGAEHYCEKHHCLTCSAAPIFDAEGKMIGVLNMSGASYASHLHTLGIVVAAAEAITAQLSLQLKNCELALINNRLTNFFNTVSDGVLIVDNKDVVIEINPAGMTMLGKTEQNVPGIPINELFDRRSGKILTMIEPYVDVEIMVDTKDGICHCLASREPISNEQDVVTGGIILLRPIQQVQNLVNHFNGNYATLQFSDIVGESVQIREATRLAIRAAATTSNVLIQGESGTGKEIFAQAIHNRSAQHNGPFIALNCGAIPRELIGSELFGYDEGAFTGARRGGKPGKFELASGGTLFLDEIGDMPLEQQTALLRVIQERRVTRIGSDKMIPVTVRLICATNKTLLQEVEKGTFRHDLFYRLNVLSIITPPLRDHLEDLPLLFRHFLEKLSFEQGCKLSVEPEVIEYLKGYQWPGNVRELQNIVERAASLAENGVITMWHLPQALYAPVPQMMISSSKDLQIPVKRKQRQEMAGHTEKLKIISLLNTCAGNVSRVAKELGISRKTLYNKMRLYSIQN